MKIPDEFLIEIEVDEARARHLHLLQDGLAGDGCDELTGHLPRVGLERLGQGHSRVALVVGVLRLLDGHGALGGTGVGCRGEQDRIIKENFNTNFLSRFSYILFR